MSRKTNPVKKIEGWGADLDPANRPAVPKERSSEVMTVRGRVPERQMPTVKIHRSIEHPDLTPVFGTTCPPKGLSGIIRDYAYTFSEGQLRHWFTLIAADRVDVFEGLVSDFARGHFPNIFKERGLRAPRTKNLVLAASLGAGAVGGAVYLLRKRTRR